MRTRTLITVGKPMDKDEWVVCLSDDTKRFMIPCGRVDWAVPCYGKELHPDEIREMIIFLHESLRLKEMENEQSIVE